MISWMMEVTTTMRISTFFYTIKQGIVNIWKNKLFSLASIATMTACIFLFGLFYMIVVNICEDTLGSVTSARFTSNERFSPVDGR